MIKTRRKLLSLLYYRSIKKYRGRIKKKRKNVKIFIRAGLGLAGSFVFGIERSDFTMAEEKRLDDEGQDCAGGGF